MFGVLALIFGVLAIVNASYLAYWDEKRVIIHITPYISVGISVALFSVEFNGIQWLGVFISFGLVGVIHLTSFFSDSLKK